MDLEKRPMTDDLTALLKRAAAHKMTPQEVFEQRVSFVSDGRNKDEVRRMLIESCGYPAEASERTAIVAWLRADATKTVNDLRRLNARKKLTPAQTAQWETLIGMKTGIADAIERGDHMKEREG